MGRGAVQRAGGVHPHFCTTHRARTMVSPGVLSPLYPGSQWASHLQMGPAVGASCPFLRQGLQPGASLASPLTLLSPQRPQQPCMSFRGQAVSRQLGLCLPPESGGREPRRRNAGTLQRKAGREHQISQPCLFGTRGVGRSSGRLPPLGPITLPLSWSMLAMSSAPGLSIFPFPLQAWAETSPIQCM